ncbi:MAG: hypothetical protein NTY03_11050 [Candidatus Bathyarchaeota archaeon]|nr:hypothetical protein [Candidatus Bathyarchaeota archaeon]
MTVRRGKRKAQRVVMGRRLKPLETVSEVTRRAAELGLDLEYDSDKNLLRIYLNFIRLGQIMQIPSAIRGKLARADLITYLNRGRNSVLTQRGKQMLHEIKKEKTP